MAKLDIINDELARRKAANEDLVSGTAEIIIAIEQFNKLDEMYRADEKTSRERLECLYGENRHFTGKEPIVYTSAQTEFYPFFNGPTDAECNPYFPITKVKDGTFDGLMPLYADPAKTGAHQRDADYTDTEDVPRGPALSALQAFPDYQLPDANETGEWFPANWPAAQDSTMVPGFCTPTSTPDTEVQCTLDGGSWTPPTSTPIDDPVWVPAETATALLRAALTPWRADIVSIIADLCEDNDNLEIDFWQAIVDDIDLVLAEIQVDPVFIRATGNNDPYAWGRTRPLTGAPEDARQRLITAADTGILDHVTSRKEFLTKEASVEEQVFFGIIGLRLHQANGSFAKLKSAKSTKTINDGLIADNNQSIKTLNVLKVKNS